MREGRWTQWENMKILIWITAKTWNQIWIRFPICRSISKCYCSFPPTLRNIYIYLYIFFFPEINLKLSMDLLLFQVFSNLMLFDTIPEKECRWERSKTTCDVLIKQPNSAQQKNKWSRKLFLDYQNSKFCKNIKQLQYILLFWDKWKLGERVKRFVIEWWKGTVAIKFEDYLGFCLERIKIHSKVSRFDYMKIGIISIEKLTVCNGWCSIGPSLMFLISKNQITTCKLQVHDSCCYYWKYPASNVFHILNMFYCA